MQYLKKNTCSISQMLVHVFWWKITYLQFHRHSLLLPNALCDNKSAVLVLFHIQCKLSGQKHKEPPFHLDKVCTLIKYIVCRPYTVNRFLMLNILTDISYNARMHAPLFILRSLTAYLQWRLGFKVLFVTLSDCTA